MTPFFPPPLPQTLWLYLHFHISTSTVTLSTCRVTYMWIHIRPLLLPSHSQSRPLPLSPPLRRYSSSTTTPPRPAPPPRPPRWPLARGLRAPGSRSRWPGPRSATASRPSRLAPPHRRASKTSLTWSRECSRMLVHPSAVVEVNCILVFWQKKDPQASSWSVLTIR